MKRWLIAVIAGFLIGCSNERLNEGFRTPTPPEPILKRVEAVRRSAPEYRTIDGHVAFVQEIQPEEFMFDTDLEQNSRRLQEFTEKSHAQLIIGCGFYDPSTRTMVGVVKRNGKTLSYGIWPPVGAKLYYKNNRLGITDSIKRIESDFEINDLVWLVKDGDIYVDKKRKVGVNLNVARTALGITDKSYILVFYTGKVEELADLMLRLGSHDAIGFDAGEDRAYYLDGKILKRGNNNPPNGKYDYRNLKNVLLGYRNKVQ